MFKEPGQEVAVVAAVWSLESAAELPILILCVTKPTGKRLNIKPPLKSPKLLGYQHPPSPTHAMAICSSFSFNQSVLFLDLPTDRAEDVMRDCGGRAAVETAGGEAGAHPGRHAADPRPQLRPRLLIRHPRPRQHDRRRFLFIIIQLVLINIKLKVKG